MDNLTHSSLQALKSNSVGSFTDEQVKALWDAYQRLNTQRNYLGGPIPFRAIAEYYKMEKAHLPFNVEQFVDLIQDLDCAWDSYHQTSIPAQDSSWDRYVILGLVAILASIVVLKELFVG